VERARRLEATKLVGREQELRTARAALRTAPALLLVVGEAGVGKSRFVTELAHDGQPVRWLTGRCRPIHHPTPLAPLAEAFRGIAGLSDCFDDAGPATGRYSAWSGLLESITELGPTVLVIEDLHWADRGTLQVLHFLAGRFHRNCN
jgi:predicted ATPase